MRIDRIRVDSFGKLRDRQFDLVPGLNVFYGPNEAGKSTLRTFITVTMFPNAGLKYPAPKANDSGTLDVTLEDGSTLRFEREGRKSSGTGSQICGIDDKEYISIYSLSPEDLRNVKGLQNGNIRNRFLTIPGGADLPRVYEGIDAERTALLPESRRSASCGIALLIDAEHKASMKVRDLQNRENGDAFFSELVRRRSALEKELEGISDTVRHLDQVRIAASNAESRAGDIERLRELMEQERMLAYAENVDTNQYAVLMNEVENCTRKLNEAEADRDPADIDLKGMDPTVFLRNRDKIERLERASYDYDIYRGRGETPTAVAATSPGFPILTVAGAAVAVAGAAVAATLNLLGGAAVSALGVIIAVIGLRNNRSRPETPDAPKTDPRVTALEDLLDEVARDTGIPRRGFHADVNTLSIALRNSVEYSGNSRKRSALRKEKEQAEEKLRLFLSGYGGQEGYDRAVRDSRSLALIRPQIEALRRSTASVGTAEVDADTANSDYQTADDEYREKQKELAKTEQMLKDIYGDDTVEDAITASSDASDKVYDACYRWAGLMLERMILDKASDRAYSSHRPEVLRRADGYLSQMTGGRYRINTDPRETDISIVDDTGETKDGKKWSSGLEDQVKLSLKMAVSLSLSEERPPVILDDILLTSDSVRKEGACRAISDLSKEVQVIYFTCDRETSELLERNGANIIRI